MLAGTSSRVACVGPLEIPSPSALIGVVSGAGGVTEGGASGFGSFVFGACGGVAPLLL